MDVTSTTTSPAATAPSIARLLLRAVTACGLLPAGHPGVVRAAEEFAAACSTLDEPITIGITSKGLCDVEGTPLEEDVSDLSRRLHALQFGKLVLRRGATCEQIQDLATILTAAGTLSAPALQGQLATATAGSVQLVPMSLSSLRASEGGRPRVDGTSAENAREGLLLMKALLAADDSALSAEALAHTISATLQQADDAASNEQASAWRERLCASIDAIDEADASSASKAKHKIADAIAKLDPKVRALLTSPPVAATNIAAERAAVDRAQVHALKLLHIAAENGPALAPTNVLDTIERATSQGVLSPEAVMLCAKLCTLARSDAAHAPRSEAVLQQLHASFESVLRDPTVHGYSPQDYSERLGDLSRRTDAPDQVPAFASRDIEPSLQASCIAASIVQQSVAMGFDPSGSIHFLAQRASTLVSNEADVGVAALASVLPMLPEVPQEPHEERRDGDDTPRAPRSAAHEQSPVEIAAAELRAALADTKCLMPLIKRTGRNQPCEHALAIVGSLPGVPLVPLAEQYMMNGATGLRRTLDLRLRALPVASVVELAQGLVQHGGVTPHLLSLLEGLDTSRAHATMMAILQDTSASQRRSVLQSLANTGAAMPPGLIATALIDEDPAIMTLGIDQLRGLKPVEGAFAIHAALTHLDGQKRLSQPRVELLTSAAIQLLPDGPHALASLLEAWRWTLTGHRPRACAIIAEALRPTAQFDVVVADILKAWSRSSGRLVEWLMPSKERA